MRRATMSMAGAVAIAVLAGCPGRRATDDEHDAESMRRHTVPGQARSLIVQPDERGISTIRGRWAFEVDWDAARYTEWARANMDSRFSETRSASGLAFARRLPADVQRVAIEIEGAGPPLRVRVEFVSSAD